MKAVGYAMLAFLTVSASMPSWGQQNSKPRTEYSEFAEVAVGASQNGVFAELEILRLGRHWLASFGLEGTVLSLVDYIGHEETVLSAPQLGVYFPIFGSGTDEGGPKLQRGFMNLIVRSNLLNYDIQNGKGFPLFLDLSLEWRSQFTVLTHTIIKCAYRHQMKPSDHNGGASDISGIFASIHVVVGVSRFGR
jgi:hypothetical protein